MIQFFCDNHYGAFPGRTICQALPGALSSRISFHENDWWGLSSGEWLRECDLLALDMIGGSCGEPHPDASAEHAVRSWCEGGGGLLLLHGGSAAFWQWQWWREAMALRWVRPDDPDGLPASFHPVRPYLVTRKELTAHPLAALLSGMTLPEDEVYAGLAAQVPSLTLLETTIPEGIFPQCVVAPTPWGGTQIHFLPGHAPACVQTPSLVKNIQIILEWMLSNRNFYRNHDQNHTSQL